MHLSTLFTASVAASLASAHGFEGAPKLFGRRAVADLKARNAFDGLNARHAEPARHAGPANLEARSRKVERQNTDGQCGSGFGNCATGYCCSGAGWCGVGKDYCAAPDCQFAYGPGCDANTVPPGTTTANDARTKLGSIAYGGAGIYDCVTPGTVALTYDDGPYIYTNGMLDVLKQYGAKATFFITGNNLGKGEIDNTAYPWASVIQRMNTEGHQIASHTWSHQDLSAITSNQRKNQMVYNEMALRNILGKYPTYMRPPYSSCTSASGCEAQMKTLGYIVTYFDLDTDDYNNDAADEIQVAKNNFNGNISTGNPSSSSFLTIAHDIHEQTATNLTAYMLQTLQAKGYKAVTVGECLGDPSTNWYRSSSGSTFSSTTSGAISSSSTSSAPAVSATKVSTDATCGGSSGNTCSGSTFGNCCSGNGWCGSTTDYCGTGCQSSFGVCGSNSNTASSAASTSSKPSSSSTKAASSSSSGPASSTKPTSSSKPASTTSSAASSLKPSSSSTKPLSSASSSAPSSSATVISTDATCGGTKGYTCNGSSFGNCCSVNGWCGSTSAYCGTGCQSGFGTCTSGSSSSVSSRAPSSTASSSARASSSTAPSSTPSTSTKVSTDGSCGGSGAQTCQGSSYGNCCSQYGWCGSTTGHCSSGCQSAFGTCS